ncbi:aromatic compound dioxygenase [Coleophoma crateriformis]|uniref:Aromatic compound dioxygenase n=1 Tax=Coleophoma crateriformis TaxID=565419 RepID=A0A3D8SAZ9_9HELO|nr:aromatic compound dioxygenase [Coleophoma crateriformis]
MVYIAKVAAAVAAVCFAGSAIAHPGEHHDHSAIKREVKARDQFAAAGKRSLNACSNSLKAREFNARSVARRAERARSLRERRGITTKAQKYRRDLATLEVYEAVDHNETSLGYTTATPEATIFSANTSCILAPENTGGPYYVTGELIRENVTEGQAGIPLYLEVQYVDINTCLPIEDVYVDIWNCNATGVYSGVESGQAGLDTTFLRGIQKTDAEGVVTFETIFPGHYDGRATHTHLLAHQNVSVLANGTITGGTVPHIGQVFYNEVLRSAVEATYPYNTNTQAVTTNADDMWSIVGAGTTYDPFPEYLYLGDDVTDGLMAWIQVGMNATADQSSSSYYSVAATYEADGGHASTSTTIGGGQGGNGSAPPS